MAGKSRIIKRTFGALQRQKRTILSDLRENARIATLQDDGHQYLLIPVKAEDISRYEEVFKQIKSDQLKEAFRIAGQMERQQEQGNG